MQVKLDNSGNITVDKMPVSPFSKRSVCPKCDARECYTLVRIVREVLGQRVTSYSTGHCPGGLEPETEHQHQLLPMVRFVHQNPCYGHQEEHLHRRCNYCGFVLLMEVSQ